MIAEGIIDPAKVTRSALQNAASIAALFLTTEAVVADKPEKAAPMGRPVGRHGRHGLLIHRSRRATRRAPVFGPGPVPRRRAFRLSNAGVHEHSGRSSQRGPVPSAGRYMGAAARPHAVASQLSGPKTS